MRYEIRVAGSAGPMVIDSLGAFEVSSSAPGQTCLVGELDDQAALQGALHRLMDLHVEILDVHRLDQD